MAASLDESLPEAVVQRQLDAYNRRDLAAFVASYAEDVELYVVPGTTPRLSGREALGAHYRDHRFNLPALHAQLLHRIVLGTQVIDHERVTGVSSQAVEAVAAYEVAGGLIRRVWMFMGSR